MAIRKASSIQSRDINKDDKIESFLDLIKDDPRFSDISKKADQGVAPKLNLLQRVGSGLSALATGNAAYKALYEGEDFLKTYSVDAKRKLKELITGRRSEPVDEKTYKDILTRSGFKDKPGKIDFTDIGGFGLDVLADPTTFGGSAVGREIAKRGSQLAKLSRKIPFVDEISSTVKRAFTPEIKNVANRLREFDDKGINELTDKFVDASTRLSRGGTVTINQANQEIAKIEKLVRSQIGQDNMPKIIDVIETGVKSGDKIIDEQAEMLSQFYKKRLDQVRGAGVEVAERDLYAPHVATNEYLSLKSKAATRPSSVTKPLRVKLESRIERTFTSYIDEAGNRVFGGVDELGLERLPDGKLVKKGTQDIVQEIPPTVKEANDWSAKELGVKMFEDNPYKAQAKYFMDTEKAIRLSGYIDELKTMGKVADGQVKEVVDEAGVKWVQPQTKSLEGVLLPEDVAKYVDEMNKILTKDEATANLLSIYDKVLNIWKGSVYGWFPSSHTTNVIGGLFHNYVAGVHDPYMYILGEKAIKKTPFELSIKKGADAGKKISSKKLLKELDEYGVIGESGYLDAYQGVEELAGRSIGKKISKAPAKLMTGIEDRLRIPLYLDGRAKGMSPKEAADRVLKFHFDYTPEGLSKFERNVMKRIIPFYTFTRNAVPLHLEQMLINPAKYAAIFKAQTASGLTPDDEEYKFLPKYLQEQILLRTKDDKIYAGFKLPFEEALGFVEDPVRKIGVSVAPTFKIPIELLTGKNIFRDIDIQKDTNGRGFKNAPNFFKDFMEYAEVEVPGKDGKEGYTRYFVNPFKKYAIENFPFTSRIINTIQRVSNGESNTDSFRTLTTAIKDYELSDLGYQKSVYEKELLLELQDMLERLGGGYYYSNFIYTRDDNDKKRDVIKPLNIKNNP